MPGAWDEHERAANAGARRFSLLADEALAVSDPIASEAIARALLEVAQERQVILFTNEPDDVLLLQRVRPELAVRSFPVPVRTSA